MQHETFETSVQTDAEHRTQYTPILLLVNKAIQDDVLRAPMTQQSIRRAVGMNKSYGHLADSDIIMFFLLINYLMLAYLYCAAHTGLTTSPCDQRCITESNVKNWFKKMRDETRFKLGSV